MAANYDNTPAYSPPRNLDWEMLALKLAIVAPDMYSMFTDFDAKPYEEERPAWILAYVAAQEALGIYPMNGAEGECMRKAIWKLMGK